MSSPRLPVALTQASMSARRKQTEFGEAPYIGEDRLPYIGVCSDAEDGVEESN